MNYFKYINCKGLYRLLFDLVPVMLSFLTSERKSSQPEQEEAIMADKQNRAIYLTHREIKSQCGSVSSDWLRQWVGRGFVRSIKVGTHRQSGRLYNLHDVQDVLDRLAAGYTPRKKRRKAQTNTESTESSQSQGGVDDEPAAV